MKILSTWIAIGIALVGCSSSSSGGDSSAQSSCGKVAPCGGNIVGTWKIVASCAQAPSSSTPGNACTNGGTVQAISVDASGTATFNADMTYSVNILEMDSETVEVPLSCLSTNGVMGTCADLASAISGVGTDAGTSASCTTAGANCTCTVSESGTTLDETGTYTVSGTAFATMQGTGANTGMGGGTYCVQGNTLTLSSVDASGTAPTIEFVATRQ
jgi:hypothetical protein